MQTYYRFRQSNVVKVALQRFLPNKLMVTSKERKVISRTSTIESDYKWGFVTDIEEDIAPKGLNEDIVRLI